MDFMLQMQLHLTHQNLTTTVTTISILFTLIFGISIQKQKDLQKQRPLSPKLKAWAQIQCPHMKIF